MESERGRGIVESPLALHGGLKTLLGRGLPSGRGDPQVQRRWRDDSFWHGDSRTPEAILALVLPFLALSLILRGSFHLESSSHPVNVPVACVGEVRVVTEDTGFWLVPESCTTSTVDASRHFQANQCIGLGIHLLNI